MVNPYRIMSTATLEAKARATEFAQNYPFRGEDGHFGPVSIANVNRAVEITKKDGSTELRDIVNLCLRTPNSKGSNATISAPSEWNKFGWARSGGLVEVVMENGFIKKIIKSVAEPVSRKGAAKVNTETGEILDEQSASAAVKEVVEKAATPATELAGAEDGKPF